MSNVDGSHVSDRIFDHVSGRLTTAEKTAVEAHLAGCAECRKLEAEERVAADLLQNRLPHYAAGEALKARLAATLREAAPPPAPKRPARLAALAPAFGVLAAAAALLFVVEERHQRDASDAAARALVGEAVNDHLRVLYAERPIEIESGGIHQVKPWFSGRLDFAPVVAFDGDAEYVLEGGSVGYVMDRKAAVFVYKVRLHTLSLFVFRADGLTWPEGTVLIGAHRATSSSQRGFNVLMLQSGDLGYALVSDASEGALTKLMGKVLGAP
jgi:anti-sigma factor RsiW